MSSGRDALGHLARVDEDERRAVLADELGHARRRSPPTARASRRRSSGEGGTSTARSSSRKVPGVDERALAAGADQEAADLVERLLGGGEPDALDRAAASSASSRSSESARCDPRLSRDEGVDLVHDRRSRRCASMRAAAVAREQQVERLGRRDQDVRRPPGHRRALAGRRVARAHEHAHLGQEGLAARGSRRADPGGSSARRCESARSGET